MKLKITTKELGFTLIELLVVVAIIGLLAAVVMVSLSSARVKSRDARRLSDIQQIKSGLDIYYNLATGYPDAATWNTAQSSSAQILCTGTPTLKVPQDPLNLTFPSYAYTYTHGGNAGTGCGDTVYANYKVQFQTEQDTSIGTAGTYWLSASNGITSTDPF